MDREDQELADAGAPIEERVHRLAVNVKHGAKRQRRQDLVLMASLLIAIVGVGLYVNSQFASDLRDAAVSACERQNEVRNALVVSFKTQNEAARATDPASDEFRKLLARSIGARQEAIHSLTPTNCQEAYP